MTMQDQLRALIERHCLTIRDYVDHVGDNLDEMVAERADARLAYERAVELAHQIKGTSGSIGFYELSRLAALFGDYLQTLYPVHGAAALDRGGELMHLFAEMHRLAHAIRPQDSTLYDADLSRLDRG